MDGFLAMYIADPSHSVGGGYAEQESGLATGTLSYQLSGGAPQPAPPEALNGTEWALELPSGSYNFSMTFGMDLHKA